MDKENLKNIIYEYLENIPKNIVERDLKIKINEKLRKAYAIIGPRRSGKSYFLFSLLKKYKGIYINFDDKRLEKIKFEDLLETALEFKYKEKINYIFLDEVQNLEGWGKIITTLINYNFVVVFTGSNSKMLSLELYTGLRGKVLPYFIFPLSFKEFLKFKNIKLEKEWWLKKQRFVVFEAFKEYFEFGGFPEVVLSNEYSEKQNIINSYFDLMLFQDIVERKNIKNIFLLKKIIKYIFNNYSRTFSIVKLKNTLKSNNIPFSYELIYSIIDGLRNSMNVFFLKKYDKSFKKTEFSKSKIYLLDLGYIEFITQTPKDIGRRLENLVFLKLQREKIFYWKESKECDFLILNKNKVKGAIQVTYEMNEENKEREIKGLLEAMERFELNEGLILTYDQEEDLEINGKKIKIRKIWKWLLEVYKK